jgi:hypothetical protein
MQVPDDNRERNSNRNKKQGDTESYAEDRVLKTSILIDGHKTALEAIFRIRQC